MKHIPSSGELYATIDTVRDTLPDEDDQAATIVEIRRAIDAVEALERAHVNMQERAYWVRTALHNIERADINGHLSSLGELQGAGPSLDVAVAVFCERQQAARAAMARLEKLTGLGAEL